MQRLKFSEVFGGLRERFRTVPDECELGGHPRKAQVGYVLGRPTLATLESTAFLALGFGAVNGQNFRTRRDPLGRFTLFLISQLVSGSRVSLTQGRAGPAGSGNCRERARVLQSRCGRIEFFAE